MKKRGFTLTELVIAMLVIILVVLIVVPVTKKKLEKADKFQYYMAYKTVNEISKSLDLSSLDMSTFDESGSVLTPEDVGAFVIPETAVAVNYEKPAVKTVSATKSNPLAIFINKNVTPFTNEISAFASEKARMLMAVKTVYVDNASIKLKTVFAVANCGDLGYEEDDTGLCRPVSHFCENNGFGNYYFDPANPKAGCKSTHCSDTENYIEDQASMFCIDKNNPICPKGMGFSRSQQKCMTCSNPNEYYDESLDQCAQTPACDSGWTFSPADGMCHKGSQKKCPDGYELNSDGTKCVRPAGEHTCNVAEGEHYFNGACIKCTSPLFFMEEFGCTCPDGQEPRSYSSCYTCEGYWGRWWSPKNRKCNKCPIGKIRNVAEATCEDYACADPDKEYSDVEKECVRKCNKPHEKRNDTDHSCECEYGYEYYQSECVEKCPSGTVRLSDGNCGTAECPDGLYLRGYKKNNGANYPICSQNCPEGQAYNMEHLMSTTWVAEGQYYLGDLTSACSSTCERYDDGSDMVYNILKERPADGLMFCYNCRPGQTLQLTEGGTQIGLSAGGTMYDFGIYKCVNKSCETGTWVEKVQQCVTCENGRTPDSNGNCRCPRPQAELNNGSCGVCPNGYDINLNTGECIKKDCPEGQVWGFQYIYDSRTQKYTNNGKCYNKCSMGFKLGPYTESYYNNMPLKCNAKNCRLPNSNTSVGPTHTYAYLIYDDDKEECVPNCTRVFEEPPSANAVQQKNHDDWLIWLHGCAPRGGCDEGEIYNPDTGNCEIDAEGGGDEFTGACNTDDGYKIIKDPADGKWKCIKEHEIVNNETNLTHFYFCDRVAEEFNMKSSNCSGVMSSDILSAAQSGNFNDAALTSNPPLVFANGQIMYVLKNSPVKLGVLAKEDGTWDRSNKGFVVYVDINGKPGKSRLWEDVFPFYLTMDGQVIPAYRDDVSAGGNSSEYLSFSILYDDYDSEDQRHVKALMVGVDFREAYCSTGAVTSEVYCKKNGSTIPKNAVCNNSEHACRIKVNKPFRFF